MSQMTFQHHWKFPLRSSVKQLWPFVSNSDRFRASGGLPAAKFTEESLPDGSSRRIGRFRIYGFPFEWTEEPFEWIEYREFTDIQVFRHGALGYLKVRVQLQPRADGGTDVDYHVTSRPGNILGYPGIPIQIGIFFRLLFGRAFQRIDQFIQNSEGEPFSQEHTPFTPAGRLRLEDMARKLSAAGFNPTLVSRLVVHLTNAPDHELTRMRPFQLADAWQVDRYQLLEVFLQATKQGMVDLSWDLLCPDCRGAKRQARSLMEVSREVHCASCNIDYEVDFAKSVEATFGINQAIRPIQRNEYCLGSPQNTPHIVLQQHLQPGETRTLTVDLETIRYRWRAPIIASLSKSKRTIYSENEAANGRQLFNVSARGNNNATVVWVDNAGLHIDVDEVNTGTVTLTLRNDTDRSQVILLEKTTWSDQAVTAAEITTIQSFRDLFSSEVLRPGESIGVERLTIMFTDLKGSTAMYQKVGDAPAFRRVMDHFTILREGVQQHHGALVKTIGDAIMAAFTDPVHALEATFQVLQEIEQYNRENDVQLILKLGVHQGTCIAVTLNERLDYFGTVVNLAARLEGQSAGNDVVISEAMMADPAVKAFLASQPVQTESFNAGLKGFSESIALHRVTLLPAARQSATSPATSRTA